MERKLQKLLAAVTPTDRSWFERARARNADLIMPPRALGRLHDLAERLCAIQATLTPDIGERAVLVMAADHGVTAEGVSAFPAEVTPQMVAAFVRGWAGINALAGTARAKVLVADLGVAADLSGLAAENPSLLIRKIAPGTANMARGPAMTRNQARESILTGAELADLAMDQGARLLATGDMGIGNTTASTAIGAVLTGQDPEALVGPGTGLDRTGLDRKLGVIRRALTVNAPDPGDPLDVLAKVGGFEIGAITGLILAAAARRTPVVVDGFISTAGALTAAALCPACRDFMFAGHVSAEPGHAAMLDHLGLSPILALGMRLGEGTGAVLAVSILDAAVAMFTEVKTFEEAEIGPAVSS
ncbi:MAG: nicotinate-nucleotide--dimethylbenzimidazole phosphoribosyltransferase [Deltaproteobacteria bacterium]|nr:nicotinate-nucleotide--dimethylbenzimidazole phosphoribosyltransferase [Deltaproteobacteria bacterium]